MSLLSNKRKRSESISSNQKSEPNNNFNIMESKDIKLDDNSICGNNRNNSYNIISRKENKTQNYIIISLWNTSNLEIRSLEQLNNTNKISSNDSLKNMALKSFNNVSPPILYKSYFFSNSSFNRANNHELLSDYIDHFSGNLDLRQKNLLENESIFDFHIDKKLNKEQLNIQE